MNKLLNVIRKTLLIAFIIYAGLFVFLSVFQRSLLYVPGEADHYVAPQEVGLKGFEEVLIRTEDGLTLKSWYLPAQKDQSTIVFFHGNAGGLMHRVQLMEAIQASGMGVLALEYRGFSGNAGSPSERGFYKDARAAMSWFELNQIKPKDTIIMGRSLGSAVAVQMAQEYDARMVVLLSPFTSIADVARRVYWYMPVDFVLLDKFDSLTKIANINDPLVVFHGDRDGLVPYSMGQAVFTEAGNKLHFSTLRGYGHYNLDFGPIINEVYALSHQPTLHYQ